MAESPRAADGGRGQPSDRPPAGGLERGRSPLPLRKFPPPRAGPPPARAGPERDGNGAETTQPAGRVIPVCG